MPTVPTSPVLARTAATGQGGVRAPETTALVSIAVLAVAAWAALIVEAARAPGADSLLDVVCRPSALSAATDAPWLAQVAPTFWLWLVMCLAMMLPTSVPMLLAAVERLDERGVPAKQARLVPLAMLAGYGAVWVGLSAAAAILQTALSAAVASVSVPAPALAVATGAAVGFAGLYQFSDLKLRFLSACRHPLTGLPSQHTGLTAYLRLGAGQAVRCLGCCAGVMALMGIAGLMNLAWMGALAVAMTVERLSDGVAVPRIVGALLLIAGVVLAVAGVGVAPILAALRAG